MAAISDARLGASTRAQRDGLHESVIRTSGGVNAMLVHIVDFLTPCVYSVPKLKLLRDAEPREADLGGWVLRGGVTLFFLLTGIEKFPSGPGAPWVAVFEQIGIGQWFRYLTGAIQVVGGILFLFPRTCLIGAAMLASTMLGAMLVHIVVRHSVASSIFPALVLVAVVAIAARERD
jgi:putative oxidoreductase